MYLNIVPGQVQGLGEYERVKLGELVKVYNYHYKKNKVKARYYEGHISLDEVNLGIAIPDGMSKLEIGCEWGGKCVDVLAGRSMFDGFVGSDGTDTEELNYIATANRLKAEYMKACRDELKFGCTFATLSADRKSVV